MVSAQWMSPTVTRHVSVPSSAQRGPGHQSGLAGAELWPTSSHCSPRSPDQTRDELAEDAFPGSSLGFDGSVNNWSASGHIDKWISSSTHPSDNTLVLLESGCCGRLCTYENINNPAFVLKKLTLNQTITTPCWEPNDQRGARNK